MTTCQVAGLAAVSSIVSSTAGEPYACMLGVDGSITCLDTSGHVVWQLPDLDGVCLCLVEKNEGDATDVVWVGLRGGRGIARYQADHPTPTSPASPLPAENTIVTFIGRVGHGRVVSNGTSDRIVVWSNQGEKLQVVSSPALGLAAATIGSELWCGAETGEIAIVSLLSGAVRRTRNEEDTPVTCMAFATNVDTVWAGTDRGQIQIYDAWSGDLVAAPPTPHTESVTALAFDSSTRQMWSAATDGSLAQWASRPVAVLRNVSAIKGYWTSIAVSFTSDCAVVFCGGTMDAVSIDVKPYGSDAISKLLGRTEELETDLVQAREISTLLQERTASHDHELQFKYYEERIEELEHQVKVLGKRRFDDESNTELASRCAALETNVQQSTRESETLRRQLTETNAVARSLDKTVRQLTDEATVKTVQLRSRSEERAGLLRRLATSISAVSVARAVGEAHQQSLASYEDAVQSLHSDHTAAAPLASEWSGAEIEALEGILLENDAMKVQLGMMEHVVSATKSRRGDDNSETVVQCFLELRRNLPPQLANEIIIEALEDSELTESEAVKHIVRSLAQRVS